MSSHRPFTHYFSQVFCLKSLIKPLSKQNYFIVMQRKKEWEAECVCHVPTWPNGQAAQLRPKQRRLSGSGIKPPGNEVDYSAGVSHGCRQGNGFEFADLEPVLLLLVPPLHLFQLCVQTPGHLPEPRRLVVVVVLHLRRSKKQERVTRLIKANPTSLDLTNGWARLLLVVIICHELKSGFVVAPEALRSLFSATVGLADWDRL